MKDKRSVLGASKERLFQAKDAVDREEERDYWPSGQVMERTNRSENRQGQADEEHADEELAAQELACANVIPCGYATDRCPQSIEKSSAWWGVWLAY